MISIRASGDQLELMSGLSARISVLALFASIILSLIASAKLFAIIPWLPSWLGAVQLAGLIRSGRPNGFGLDSFTPTSFAIFASSTASHASIELIPNASNVPIATTQRSIRPSTISSASSLTIASRVSSYSSLIKSRRNSMNFFKSYGLAVLVHSCTPYF